MNASIDPKDSEAASAILQLSRHHQIEQDEEMAMSIFDNNKRRKSRDNAMCDMSQNHNGGTGLSYMRLSNDSPPILPVGSKRRRLEYKGRHVRFQGSPVSTEKGLYQQVTL